MSNRKRLTLKDVKHDFNDVYDQDDARNYFRSLVPLDYIIPHLGQNIFLQLIEARRDLGRKTVNVLDLGCSYGINAALMNHVLTWDILVQRQMQPEMMLLPSAAMRRLDRLFLESWPRRLGVRVTGIDVAGRAVGYAKAVGALDEGFAVDLEKEPMPERLHRELQSVDLIASTGCVGYVTEKSFAKLARSLAGLRPMPWVASFVLRSIDYAPIAAELARIGLVTEKFEGVSFIQRRFADLDEMQGTLALLNGRGIDASAHEARGLLHAELFLSRPEEERARRPIGELLSLAIGANKPYLQPARAMSGSMLEPGHGSTSLAAGLEVRGP